MWLTFVPNSLSSQLSSQDSHVNLQFSSSKNDWLRCESPASAIERYLVRNSASACRCALRQSIVKRIIIFGVCQSRFSVLTPTRTRALSLLEVTLGLDLETSSDCLFLEEQDEISLAADPLSPRTLTWSF